ncbi:IcmT/TraK family protein [Stenotrophomonas maltophilia]|uniref:IcmT/TraK family protein n=2 Tax=Stenotrophomonas maltophilia TaxID=40324 RepID=UPI0018EA73C4
MAGKENQSRMSGGTVRLFFFDAVAGVPLILTFFYLKPWTVLTAAAVFVVVGVVERVFGYGPKAGLRRLRCLFVGKTRLGQPWWSNRQDRY